MKSPPCPTPGATGRRARRPAAAAALAVVLAATLLGLSPGDGSAADATPAGPYAGESRYPNLAYPGEAGTLPEFARPRMAELPGTPVVLGLSVERRRGPDDAAWTGAGVGPVPRSVLWTGLRRQISPSASLTWQVPMDAENGPPWRLADAQETARRSELSLGLQLQSPKGDASGLRGALRLDISAQTHVLLKPRKGRVGVVLTSTW